MKNSWIVLAGLAFLSGSDVSVFAEPLHTLWNCRGITLRQFGADSIPAGSIITYRIHVSNEGSCDLQGAVLTDYLPRLTTYQTATPTPSDNPGGMTAEDSPPPMPVDSVDWKNIHLAPTGASADYEVSVKVGEPGGRMIVNTVCFEHPQAGRICDELDTFVRRE